MIIIDRIEKRRGNLVEVWSDEELVAVMRQYDAQINLIVPGARIDREELLELARRSMLKKAENRAAWLLSARDYSKKKLISRVAEMTGKEAAEEVAERLREQGYIDDERNAQRWAERMLFEKLYSARRTILELMQKGIDRQTAEQAVELLEPDENEQLDRLIEKKYAHKLEDEADIRRTFSSLERMGYGIGAIRRAVERAKNREDC